MFFTLRKNKLAYFKNCSRFPLASVRWRRRIASCKWH